MRISLHHCLLTILFSVYFLSPLSAAAEVYESVDEEGVSHYSDTANNESYVLILKSELPVIISNQTNTQDTASTIDTGIATSPHTSQASPQLLAQIAQSAQNNQVDSALIHAVMRVESAYQPKAQSHKGAQGLMQLMPATASRLGVKNNYDPAQNIEAAAKYLKQLLTLFNNDISLTLAAYNAGENAVIKYGNKIPPYRETQAYVPKVLKVYKALIREREQRLEQRLRAM